MDGTLCYLAADFWQLFDDACRAVFGPVLPFPAAALRTFFTKYSNQPGPVDTVGGIDAGLRSFGLNYPAAPSRIVRELLRTYTAATVFLPGSPAILDELKAAGLKLGLVTNGPVDMQRATIVQLGIKDKFDLILISGAPDVGIRKPATGIYDLALSRLGSQAATTLFVGDRLDTDIAGALASQLYAVWFNPQHLKLKPTDPQPDTIISELRELHNLLGFKPT
jgi:putative hydrolase of the HAD superfamily